MTSSPIRVVVLGVRDPSSGRDASAPTLAATSEFVLEVVARPRPSRAR